MGWEKRETRSSLNRLFKRDSRQHSFVVFGNDIVFTLGYLIVILKSEVRASWGSLAMRYLKNAHQMVGAYQVLAKLTKNYAGSWKITSAAFLVY